MGKRFPWFPLTCSADVTGGMRGPGDAVDTGAMVVEPRHGCARHTDIQDDHLPQRHHEDKPISDNVLNFIWKNH